MRHDQIWWLLTCADKAVAVTSHPWWVRTHFPQVFSIFDCVITYANSNNERINEKQLKMTEICTKVLQSAQNELKQL